MAVFNYNWSALQSYLAMGGDVHIRRTVRTFAYLNLDGKFDENDRGLTDKKRFCLTTPASFSCGNLVPCVFKNSNVVTLLGKSSGGGSCAVLPMTTAYGSFFRISGPLRLAFTKNGSFYDIDRGTEPDFTLAFPETFYDREALTETINGIR